MRRIITFLILFSILSCAKKELKIPVLDEKGIQEVQNHSQVWFFFKTETNDTIANVNRKNTISSTHWLYNIDRRLQMKEVIQTVKQLQLKHHSSMHSEEGMQDYFSYSDTISKKLSFIPFTNVDFKTDNILSKYFIKEFSEDYKQYFNVNLTFNPKNVWINDGKFEKEGLKDLLLDYIDFSAEGSQTMLHLNFNEDLTYQEFLYWRTLVHSIKNEAIKLNQIEFVFNPDKVPDCGCE
jgi:hypothetical protein